ncbi:MAG: energy-coupling factor transporter transmembrane protein EcfT [Actinomycetota bacterium]
MTRRSRDLADLTVLRYVPGDSPVHRVGALPKILGLVAMTIALTIRVSWEAIGIVAAAAVLAFVLARLPLGVVPRPPRLLWWGVAISGAFAVISGGDPTVEILGRAVELGGVEAFVRFFLVTALVLLLAGLVGWTTPAADLTPAIASILRPFGRLGLPVDELVAALSLAVRVLPMLLEELRTLAVVLRRRTVEQRSVGALVVDVLATITTTGVRRAAELGRALEARGGTAAPAVRRPWRPIDLGALVVVLSVATAAVVVG